MVQRVADNPQILNAALSHDVTALGRQGASKAELKAVGRFLLNATLSALVRPAALNIIIRRILI
jgi:hypothetical protein